MKILWLLICVFSVGNLCAWDSGITWDHEPQDPTLPDTEFVLPNEFAVFEANGPGGAQFFEVGTIGYVDGVTTYSFPLVGKNGIKCYQVYARSTGGVPSEAATTQLLNRVKFCLGPNGAINLREQ